METLLHCKSHILKNCIIQRQKGLKTKQEKCPGARTSNTPFDQRSLVYREAWFPSGPRITQNLNCLINGKNQPKRKNSKHAKHAKTCQNSDTPFNQRSLVHREAWFPPCFIRQNQPKITFFCLAIFTNSALWA